MKISRYLHSCILVEENGASILFDPGSFVFREGKVNPEDFKGISGIYITHAHGDHYDIPALKVILANNPGCKIFCNSDMGVVLAEYTLPYEIFEEGEHRVAGFKVKAFFAAHEPVLKREMVKNTAFFVNNRFLHSGDSYAPIISEHKPEVLALPVAGPWMDMNRGADFTYKCKAKMVIPVHDEHIKEYFSINMYKYWETEFSEQGIKFVSMLKAGDSIEV